MMQVNHTFDPEFDALYASYATDPKGIQLLDLDGISPDKVDVGLMSKKYFSSKLADITVDQNANANEAISPNNYQSEVAKGSLKLEGYYLLWHYTKKRYGKEEADRLMRRIWDKDIYFHDASGHGIQTIYCLAFSTAPLLTVGRPYGQLHSLVPHRADSFMAQAIETIMDISNTIMGAVAPADLLINYAYLAKKDRDELAHVLDDVFDQWAVNDTVVNENNLFVRLLASAYNLKLEVATDILFENCHDSARAAEKLMEKRIVNDFQKLVHIVNNKYRNSGQSPFTNISIYCRENLKKLFSETAFPDGTVGIDVEWTMAVQKMFGEFVSKGDPKTGLPYRFPVCTANVSIDKSKLEGVNLDMSSYVSWMDTRVAIMKAIMDKDFRKWVAKINVAKGFLNFYINDGNKIAMCCRFSNDFDQMYRFRSDTMGNGGLNIGATRVITANLPRIAACSFGEADFVHRLNGVLDDIKKLHIVHREEILARRVKQGFIQFVEPLGWVNLDLLFSTIGINGVHEMNYFAGYNILKEDGQRFTEFVLNHIEEKSLEFTKECGFSFNVEEIPAESTAPIFAAADRLMFGDNQPFELYSNQYIPLISEATVFERLKLSGRFMNAVSGGGIVHINIDEQIKDPEMMEYLIDLAIVCGVPHFAVNYGFGTCTEGHNSIVGNGTVCPICASPIQDWLTRIIGYFTKVSSWNKVRRIYEYPRRKFQNLGRIK